MHHSNECLDRAELGSLQSERLRSIVNYAYENVPFYRDRFDAAGVSPTDIDGIADISALPMTTKECSIENGRQRPVSLRNGLRK